jgi:uncharacterized protein YjbI with pentapeptide repeats
VQSTRAEGDEIVERIIELASQERVISPEALGTKIISGQSIRGALEDPRFASSSRGLAVFGVEVIGNVDLSFLSISKPVMLRNVAIVGDVIANESKLGSFTLRDCEIRNVDFGGSIFNGPVNLSHSDVSGSVYGIDATINGSLDLTMAALRGGITLDRIEINGILAGKFLKSYAQFRLCGAKIKGQALFDEAFFRGVNEPALSFETATIGDSLSLIQAEIFGSLLLTQVSCNTDVWLNNATIFNPWETAVYAGGAQVEQNVDFSRASIFGQLNFSGSHIGGILDLDYVTVSNPGAIAIMLVRTEVGIRLSAIHCSMDGRFLCAQMVVRGSINLNNSVLSNAWGEALDLTGTRCLANLNMSQTSVIGSIDLSSVDVRGSMIMRESRISKASGSAIILNNSKIGENVRMSVRSEGRVVGISLFVKGLFLLTGNMSTLSNNCLDLTRSRFGSHLTIERFSAVGGNLRLVDIGVDGSVRLEKVSVEGTGTRKAVVFDKADIQGSLVARHLKINGDFSARFLKCRDRVDVVGPSRRNRPAGLDLERSEIGELSLSGRWTNIDAFDASIRGLVLPWSVEGAAKLGKLEAVGWEVKTVHGGLRADSKIATTWLSSQAEGSPQPWVELADAYDRQGLTSYGRRLRYRAAQIRPKASLVGQVVHALSRVSSGHGLYPFLAAMWLLVSVSTSAIVAHQNRESFVPLGNVASAQGSSLREVTGATPCDELVNYPCFSAPLYAIGASTPANAITTVRWAPDGGRPGALQYVLAALRGLGWLSSLVFVAGVTGLLRRRS